MNAADRLQQDLEKYFLKARTPTRIKDLMLGLFTQPERDEFAKRLEIVKRLKKGVSQRKIAKSLDVGIATVSRGARELSQGRFKHLQ